MKKVSSSQLKDYKPVNVYLSLGSNLGDRQHNLDEALELFQEGVERLKTARKLLQETELTVQQVVKAADADLPDDDIDD